jgi:hypothetical protein
LNIYVCDVEEWERGILKRELSEDHDLQFCDDSIDPQRSREYSDAEVLSPFIYSNLSEEIIKGLKDLKFIATRTTGIRSMIAGRGPSADGHSVDRRAHTRRPRSEGAHSWRPSNREDGGRSGDHHQPARNRGDQNVSAYIPTNLISITDVGGSSSKPRCVPLLLVGMRLFEALKKDGSA